MLQGIKKELVGRGGVVEKERLMVSEINWERKIWKVETVYVRDNMEKVPKEIRRGVDKRKREKG